MGDDGKAPPSAPDGRLPVLYTPDQVAAYLGVSVRTVKRFIASRKLPAKRYGRAVRVTEADLQKFVADGTGQRALTSGPAARPGSFAGAASSLDREMVFQVAQQTARRRRK